MHVCNNAFTPSVSLERPGFVRKIFAFKPKGRCFQAKVALPKETKPLLAMIDQLSTVKSEAATF